MQDVRIRFTKSGSSTVFGNFADGDLLTCSAAAAKHFVEDASCAEYVEPQSQASAPAAAEPAAKKPAAPKAKRA